jgi:hypothetical protein
MGGILIHESKEDSIISGSINQLISLAKICFTFVQFPSGVPDHFDDAFRAVKHTCLLDGDGATMKTSLAVYYYKLLPWQRNPEA